VGLSITPENVFPIVGIAIEAGAFKDAIAPAAETARKTLRISSSSL
jgi:hypothetical protein